MRRALSLALTLSALIAAGCGDGEEGTPVACLEGADAYLTALQRAPGEVRLQGETPISDCLAENQTGGDLTAVGGAMLEAATELNAAARADPGGAANLQLGYLVGAAERGAEETEGIHAELLRRIEAAARYSPADRPLLATFLETYRRGQDAGRARG